MIGTISVQGARLADLVEIFADVPNSRQLTGGGHGMQPALGETP